LHSFIATYGEHALVEGVFEEGDHLVLIDDLATKFDSKLIALEQVRSEMDRLGSPGITVENVAVILDREQGAQDVAATHGIRLHSLIPFRSKGLSWLAESLSSQEYKVLSDYLADPGKYQDLAIQEKLRHMAVKEEK